VTKGAVTIMTIPLRPTHGGTVAVVSINRPQAGNALNAPLISELTDAFSQLSKPPVSRAVILIGQGRNFCAGADIGWMQAAAAMNFQENCQDAGLFATMLERYASLPMPTIAVVQGAAYGGALGLVAASNIAFAVDSARFALSEVRLGLLPAMILPYLKRKISIHHLERFALTGAPFDAISAQDIGLIHHVATTAEISASVAGEISGLLNGAPEAQLRFKKLIALPTLSDTVCREAIAGARTGAEGQAGLKSFLAKSQPQWHCSLPDGWRIPWDEMP
jgi:methylglutaconyl-CoA hydratase